MNSLSPADFIASGLDKKYVILIIDMQVDCVIIFTVEEFLIVVAMIEVIGKPVGKIIDPGYFRFCSGIDNLQERTVVSKQSGYAEFCIHTI